MQKRQNHKKRWVGKNISVQETEIYVASISVQEKKEETVSK